MPRQLGENGGLVAGAGADVEHPVARANAERGCDQRDHVRLRDRLAVPEQQSGVLVGKRTLVLGHKQLAWHASHRVEHQLVADPAARKLPVSPITHRESRCSATSALTPVIDAGGSARPTVSIGTSESAASSEP